MCPRHPRRRTNLHVVADQRCLDSPHPANGRAPEHDLVLDLTVINRTFRRDCGEWADVRSADLAPTVGPSWPASKPSAPPCPAAATLSGPPGCTAAWSQFHPHHDQAGPRRYQSGGGRRPAWPAHLDGRRRPADLRPHRRRRAARHLPCHQQRADHQVRAGCRGVPARVHCGF